MNLIAVSSFLWAVAIGNPQGDSFEPVLEIPPHIMVTAREVTAYTTPGQVFHVRVLSFADYRDADRECNYEYCKDKYLYLVVHDIGEFPIFVVLRSQSAFGWRDIQVSDFVTRDGLRFTFSLTGERDLQGNREYDAFRLQVYGTLRTD